jgi:putative ATPase
LELKQLFKRAHQHTMPDLAFEEAAIDALISHADGDARRLLNLVEQIRNAVSTPGLAVKLVDQTFIENALTAQARRFDKGGDQFYDQISALHKSVRGSHPDAALYWFCRMLDGGVDPRYLARRIIRMAWEDIGLADPRAMQLANDAAQTYERLGSPEGELALGQAVVYLAVASKSNASYKAFNAARAYVANDQSKPVPNHLRNAPTQLMKELGHGKEYRYAHDEPHAYAAGETYLPEGMKDPHWYEPVERGLETQIKEKMAFLRKLDVESKK